MTTEELCSKFFGAGDKDHTFHLEVGKQLQRMPQQQCEQARLLQYGDQTLVIGQQLKLCC